MKRIFKSCPPPKALADYIASHPAGDPAHTWADFCNDSKQGKKDVQKRIRDDQGGICAYCEIDLLSVPSEKTACNEAAEAKNDHGGDLKADFRVEHFHPKSDLTHNWALDWNNLIGCCCGGNEEKVVDSKRFLKKVDRHCDVKKKDRNLDDSILNPLKDIPAYPCIWEIDDERSEEETIYLKANKNACDSCSSDCYRKADTTLDRLNLNSKFLAESRYAAIGIIMAKIKEKAEHMPFEQALQELMEATFHAEAKEVKKWPPFFSTIRAKFGVAAEMQLKAIGFSDSNC